MRSAATAISALERLVRNEPGRERAWGLLMQALYSTGRQHEALGAFQRARQVLAESYGLEPGPDLRSLERRILDQDPSLGSTTGRVALAAALHTSTPLVGRTSELAALDIAWRMAREGAGQLRILSGPIDVGRTRLAADLAGRAIAVGGDVEYVRAADGLDSLAALIGTGGPMSPGVIVDAVAHRCRRGPMILIIDDMEWAPGPVVTTIAALTSALEGLALLVVLIVDPSGGGPAVAAIGRLDPEQARTLSVGPMSDADIAAVVVADGVEDDAVPPVVALADGRPGAARREAAAWAERTASERLRAATVSSAGALAVAQQAQVSVLDEVVELVAARARRDEMRSATWVGRQPYRALASYGPQDAELFVGRERLVAELATRVLERRLVVVVGPSGSGKSSLVRAGLIPLARSGRLPGDTAWRTHIMVPGHDPLAAIDAIEDLDDPGPRLLIVDQFEEVFASLPTVVDGFATRLLDLAGDPALDVHVVIVVRSDEYGALTGVGGLSAAAQDAQLLVGPPTDAEMRRIVEEPARRTGLSVEPALVDLVARDVGGYDSALPLVSAAMAEVWERRTGVELSADRYLEIGGLATAVERLGEQAMDRAGSSSDEVRRLLLRLADVTDDGLWTRRRVPINDVPDELLAAVDALVATRLVVRSETTIEIVHEVVFRAWPRLVCWLEEARADLIRERDLIVAARMWDAEGRSDDNVYRGARLEAGAEWIARHGDQAGTLVGPFLDAGRRRTEREADEARVRLGPGGPRQAPDHPRAARRQRAPRDRHGRRRPGRAPSGAGRHGGAGIPARNRTGRPSGHRSTRRCRRCRGGRTGGRRRAAGRTGRLGERAGPVTAARRPGLHDGGHRIDPRRTAAGRPAQPAGRRHDTQRRCSSAGNGAEPRRQHPRRQREPGWHHPPRCTDRRPARPLRCREPGRPVVDAGRLRLCDRRCRCGRRPIQS